MAWKTIKNFLWEGQLDYGPDQENFNLVIEDVDPILAQGPQKAVAEFVLDKKSARALAEGLLAWCDGE